MMRGAAPHRVGRLHVITDETLQSRFDHAALAGLAARGGADTVQYREKRPVEEHLCAGMVERMRRELAPYPVRLIVNDRVGAARRGGADGVHLGLGDMAAGEARALLGEEALIGATAHSLAEALAAAAEPVDYLGVGPVFGTRSKEDPAPRLGLDALRAIVEAVELPVVAIGGIHAENLGSVLEAGAYGVAVLSAFVCAEEPERATRELAMRIASYGETRHVE